MAHRDLSRRRFLRLAGVASIATALPRTALAGGLTGIRIGQRYDDGTSEIPGGLDGEVSRVLVIGAGFAGLAAANALDAAGVECIVLEARGRVGGRAYTAQVGGSPIDLGCSWIHDPYRNPMTQLAIQSGVLETPADIELDIPTSRVYDAERGGPVLLPDTAEAVYHMERFYEESPRLSDQLGPLASARDGILRYLDEEGLTGDSRRLAEYVLRLVTELPDATDWEKISLRVFAHGEGAPYLGIGEGNYPRGGYSQLAEALVGSLDVRFGHHVTAIHHDRDGVTVRAEPPGGAPPIELSGSHLVVTIPLGVLKTGSIAFSPGLPADKLAAIGRIGCGNMEKVVMRFPEAFWTTEHTHIFHLSAPTLMKFPMILDYQRLLGIPVLAAFNTGASARELQALTKAEVQARMLDVLRTVQGGSVPDPTHVEVTRWSHHPQSLGSYPFLPPGSTQDDLRAMAEPLGGRLLFAGDATSATRYGYADGALSSGIREAKRLLQQSSVELRTSLSPPL